MPNNPKQIHCLATDHIAELRRHGVSSESRRAVAPKNLGGIRTRSGWLLVGLGLRLVVPHARATNRMANRAGH
jgi:hypothetical protein